MSATLSCVMVSRRRYDRAGKGGGCTVLSIRHFVFAVGGVCVLVET